MSHMYLSGSICFIHNLFNNNSITSEHLLAGPTTHSSHVGSPSNYFQHCAYRAPQITPVATTHPILQSFAHISLYIFIWLNFEYILYFLWFLRLRRQVNVIFKLRLGNNVSELEVRKFNSRYLLHIIWWWEFRSPRHIIHAEAVWIQWNLIRI